MGQEGFYGSEKPPREKGRGMGAEQTEATEAGGGRCGGEIKVANEGVRGLEREEVGEETGT